MKKRLLIVLLSLFMVGPVAAETWEPGDFAYGIPMLPEGDVPVALVQVPDLVYQDVFRSDLGDVRVFNHRGDIVPHMIRKAQKAVPVDSERLPLSIFPLPEREMTDTAYRVHIRTDKDGAVVDIDRTAGTLKDGTPAGAYLIDVSSLKQPLQKLRFTWPESRQGFIARISVSSSDDLEHWQRVKSGVAVADLQYEGERLVRNSVELPRKKSRYLRIAWEEASVSTAFTKIEGEPYRKAAKAVRIHKQISASYMDRETGIFEFETGGFYPVTEVNLKFKQANSMARGVLKSRPDKDATWRVRGRGLFYTLTMKGALFDNKPVSVSNVTDSFWRLEIDPSGGGLAEDALPTLVVHYQPQELLFVVQGEAPFTLAFGSAVVTSMDAPLNSLLKSFRKKDRDDFVRNASLGERITLGGTQQFEKSWRNRDWKLWVLWAVMIAGVLLIAVMAWRLYSRMNSDEGRK